MIMYHYHDGGVGAVQKLYQAPRGGGRGALAEAVIKPRDGG